MNPLVQFLGTIGLRPTILRSAVFTPALRPMESSEESDPAWNCWQKLSPRQQEVAALICLGFTNRQVAARLHLSPETIKTHVRTLLTKFDLPNRRSLRLALAGWDFRDWLEPQISRG